MDGYSKLCHTNCNDVSQRNWGRAHQVEWFQCGWCECFLRKTLISSECRSTCLCSHPICRNWKQWDSQVAPGWNSLWMRSKDYGSEGDGLVCWLSFIGCDRTTVQGLHRRKCRSPVCPWADSLGIKNITVDSQHVSGTISSITKYGPFAICTYIILQWNGAWEAQPHQIISN